MDLHSVTGQLPELHVLHQPHQTLDLLQQVSQQQLHQELQPAHVLQQQVVGLADLSQSIRSKLENLNYQLHNLGSSGTFPGIHLDSNWRLSEKNQVRGRT